MEKVESCSGCELPCIGTICQYYEYRRFFCDECGTEAPLYEYEGQQLCSRCLCNNFKKVEGSGDE